MDFLLANAVLENVQEDLEEGFLEEACRRLKEIGRLGIAGRMGRVDPEDEPEAPKSSGVRLKARPDQKDEPESPVFSKRKKRDWKLPIGEDDGKPNVFSVKSVAKATPGKKWKKVRPGKLDTPGTPTHIAFRSVLKQWREQLESSGDDSPEALGSFLHKHFGHRKWDHKKAMQVAKKAHKKPEAFARAAADHYIKLGRGELGHGPERDDQGHLRSKSESYKVKAIWQRRRGRLGTDA
jgi:hypothetical protein